MRIANDYGMGPVIPGRHPLPGSKETRTEQVLIMRHTPKSEEKPVPGSTKGAEGIPISGTDYLLKSSDEAAVRDREVRAHEKAHLMSLGGAAASGVQLTTHRGPDGAVYAVGGGIKVDMSPVPGNPRATLNKAQAVLRAADAPGDPSAADMRVAAEAYRMVRDARENILEEGILA
ncbi:putative metalloprotease CJM1_0395 family protein [Oceanispirochaeta sp.]|uniref:putative metalloprotease CJM1_0395 family protein n=1 Tax=Oceanispirochaeta sp. TaxID=2035350 RepID=UPI0026097DE3|nr:putative metalloprotease CJM1_0395 family protein [Oceanispirochaeta sp.]MDA3957087.1 putative metalloprotease CJM1_0395 family protein [Oceanispirochaeta sp.]